MSDQNFTSSDDTVQISRQDILPMDFGEDAGHSSARALDPEQTIPMPLSAFADDSALSEELNAALRGALLSSVPDPDRSIEEELAELDRIEKRLYMCSYAATTIAYDGVTIDPLKAGEARGEARAALEELRVELLTSQELGRVLKRLKDADELDDTRKAQVRVLARDRAEAMAVSPASRAGFVRLTVAAGVEWRRAKCENNWSIFEPYLDRIVDELRYQAKRINPEKDAYDVLLDQYERGTSQEFYDKFFAEIRSGVVPLLNDIMHKGTRLSRECVNGRFLHDRQLIFSRELLALEGVDLDALTFDETEHPFSDSVSPLHNFIATHIYEDDVLSNLYSILHEGGHVLYEQGVNPAFTYTSLRGGTSMGIHESQSRFFENIVGRSFAFMRPLLRCLSSAFPGRFNNVTAHELYQAVNIVQPSLIRTEADELTYPLHIMVRYEIERALFAGEIKAADVPKRWNELYANYLGVRVPDYTNGPLQDMHWADGEFGYFPTYALGSAYDTQFLFAMLNQGINVDEVIASGDLSPICEWFAQRVWTYGRSKDALDIIADATGKPFNAIYYVKYLENKFGELYEL